MERNIEIAKNMIKLNMDIEQIRQITELEEQGRRLDNQINFGYNKLNSRLF